MNKKISLIAILFLLGACASKSKESTKTETPAPSVAAATPAPAPAKATEAGGTVKVEKKSKKVKVQNTEDANKPSVATGSKDKVVCSSGGDSRTLEIKTGEGFACEVIYTKATESKSIANAKVDTNFCAGISQKVQKHLEAAGFKCQQ